MTGECQKRVVLQMGSSSCFLLLLLHPPLPFLTSAADASTAPGHERLCTELQAQMHSVHTSVFVLVSASACTASRRAFPFLLPLTGVLLQQKPLWSSYLLPAWEEAIAASLNFPCLCAYMTSGCGL